jgi:hypothetical protein
MSTTPTPVEPSMSGPSDPHRPADDSEQVYYDGSPLLRGDLAKLFGWGALGLVLIAAGAFAGYQKLWLAALALIVLGVAAMWIPVLLARSVRYRISNYRIDYERGILGRRIDTLELWHVEDISFSQSVWDRMLGVGDIRVMSHDETTPELLLRGLPNPRPIFEQLKQRIIAVKRQRGVIKMDV